MKDSAGLLPDIPPEAAAQGLALRLETPDDRAFLARLYASTREDELQPTGWSDELKAQFLAQQFDAQTRHYGHVYQDAVRAIILVQDRPAGRLYLFPMPRDLRIIDISLLPEHRRAGIGTTLLRGVLERARARGEKASIHVEIFSPARRLYERLGFVHAGGENVYVLMEWQPAGG